MIIEISSICILGSVCGSPMVMEDRWRDLIILKSDEDNLVGRSKLKWPIEQMGRARPPISCRANGTGPSSGWPSSEKFRIYVLSMRSSHLHPPGLSFRGRKVRTQNKNCTMAQVSPITTDITKNSITRRLRCLVDIGMSNQTDRLDELKYPKRATKRARSVLSVYWPHYRCCSLDTSTIVLKCNESFQKVIDNFKSTKAMKFLWRDPQSALDQQNRAPDFF